MAFLNCTRRKVVFLTALTIVLSLLRATAQSSQDLVASWQGTLDKGQGLRIVIQVTKGTGGEPRARFYNIDRSGDAVPGAVSVDGSTVNMTFTMIAATYRGRIAPDGKSILGTWSQNAAPQPLTLTRATPGSEWAIPPTTKPAAMDPNFSPSFEVATIKPSDPEEQRKFLRLSPDHFEGLNETVCDLIGFSYGVHRKQIVDAPAWLCQEKFDISAKPDAEGAPNIQQWKTMVQKLLAERFQLSFHHGERELALYILATGAGGAKLTKSQGDPQGVPGMGFQRGAGDFAAFNASVADFINFMTRNAGLDRPLVDRTGLTGRYDFRLNWTPDEATGNDHAPNAARSADDTNAPPSLPVALQEQLGLTLSTSKGPTEVYVIDRVERPSAN